MVSKTPNKAREKNQAIGTAAKHCIGFPLIINDITLKRLQANYESNLDMC